MIDISVISLDNHILYPLETITSTNESNDKYFFALKQSGLLISDDINISFNEILNKAKELNQSAYTVSNAKDTVNLLLDNLKGITKSSLLISGLVIIFTAIGITLVQINNIKERLKDYGIHLLLGCKKKDIVIRNVYELIIYCVLGITIGFSFNLLSSNNMEGTSFDLRILTSIIFIYAFIIALISLILKRRIGKLEINEIIKGVNKE